ncbi:MAG TPA: alpha-L-rhamnosidase [Candidatus Aminicenantes bacterium]|nr:MAG: alpha-L-rhamnosidase [Candidatus Aminicenantes bacterium]HEK86063.1 alpha-L-rhamnosidase [Candidatus Aminicenantes bacterium]
MPLYPPYDLRVEYLKCPPALDIPRPRFFWKMKSDLRGDYQTAYQIIVASEREIAEKEIGDFWDSEKVISQASTHIPYAGEELLSCQKYFWRVRWWNSSGQVSPYSEVAVFGTGFMGLSKFRANWISMADPESFLAEKTILLGQEEAPNIQYKAIYLRKEFSCRGRAIRATAYISGLGYYELYLNGRRIGDSRLDPCWSDYRQVAFYSVYEVTELISDKNAIGVILGNGRHIKKYGYDQPKLIFWLEIYYEKGGFEVITSDDTWKAAHGPVEENGLYFGENYDARKEQPGWNNYGFDDSSWKKAVLVSGPPLAAQNIPPIKIKARLKPVNIISFDRGVYVFDFGQNISGWARLKVQGPEGTTIRLRYAELLNEDGSLNSATNDNARATDIYILKGQGEEIFEPHFTYHGFRYVELAGFPGKPDSETLEACFIHSDVEETGSFECSNPLINQIHRNIINSQKANLMSLPTDCPQRDERHGWLADALMTAEEASFNFDLAAFYNHFINLIRQAQKEDGSLPDFVPPYNPRVYPADPAWGSAYISLCWHLYQYYGDRDILRRHFQNLKNYIDFLKKKSTGNLQLVLGKYGDWCQPGSLVPKKTPVELVATWFYYHDILIFSEICELVGRQEEAREYRELSNQIKAAFNGAFLEKDQYKAIRQGPIDRLPDQTSNLLPLYLDLVPEDCRSAVWQNLLESIIVHHDYHLDTGIIGTRYLLDVLSRFDRPEVALKIILQESYPGWGYMIREGATTLWERWEKLTGRGMNSHNHVMFGSLDAWLYKNLVGLQPIESGWKIFRLKPFAEGEISWVKSQVQTIYGEIAVSWEKTGTEFLLELKVPVGSRAKLYFPKLWPVSKIQESEIILWEGSDFVIPENASGLAPAEKNHSPVFWVEAGDYRFKMGKI